MDLMRLSRRAGVYLRAKGPVDTVRAARNRARDWTHVARHRHQRVEWGQDVRVSGRLIIRGPGTVILGDRCRIRPGHSPTVFETLRPEAVIEIGSGCSLTGTGITAEVGVRLGQSCLMGEAWIVDTDFHSVQRDRRRPGVEALAAPIVLGDNVWVATSAMVMKGVVIGNHSVIGAHSVIRRDVPPDVIVIGNPQQIVGHLDPDVEPYWP